MGHVAEGREKLRDGLLRLQCAAKLRLCIKPHALAIQSAQQRIPERGHYVQAVLQHGNLVGLQMELVGTLDLVHVEIVVVVETRESVIHKILRRCESQADLRPSVALGVCLAKPCFHRAFIVISSHFWGGWDQLTAMNSTCIHPSVFKWPIITRSQSAALVS